MLESIGATDRHVRLVVRANGTVVGLVGAVAGLVLGLVAGSPTGRASSRARTTSSGCSPCHGSSSRRRWRSQSSRLSSPPPDPWAITRVPIVAALSGRPAPPRQIHRSAIPGIVCLVAAFLLLGYSGSTNSGNGSRRRAGVGAGIVVPSPGSSCSRRSSSRSARGWAGKRRSRPDWHFATLPATGPVRARRSRRSASACSPRSSSCSPPLPATATCSTTQARTSPRTSSPSTPTCRHRRVRRLSDQTGSKASNKVRRPRLLPRCCGSWQNTPM